MVSSSSHRYRAPHDPYNNMETASIRPENIAKTTLGDAEQRATALPQNHRRKTSTAERATERKNTLRAREEQHNGFLNSVRGRNNARTALKTPGGLFRRFGPVTAMLIFVLGGGGFFLASQSLLGAHLSALITNNTDVQFTSYHARNPRLFRFLMDGDGQIKISGFTKKYKTFSPYLKSRLKKRGIDVGHLDSAGVFHADHGLSTKRTVLKYNNEIIDADSLTTKFAQDPNFRDAYYRAKRGRVAGFFDASADRHYKNRGMTRDIFDQFQATGDSDADTAGFEKTVSDHVSGSDFDVNTIRTGKDEKTGKPTKAKNGQTLTPQVDGDTPEAKARSFLNGLSGKVSTVGVPLCSILRVANIASVVVAAYQIIQARNFFHSLIESPNKAMYGEGEHSAINETLNFLSESVPSTVDYVDENGDHRQKTVVGSALESAGAKLMLGQTKPSHEETFPYAIDNIIRAARRIAIGTGATVTVCSGVLAADALISLASIAIPGGALAKIAVAAVMQTVGRIAITAAVSAVIGAIIPYVARIFSENIFDNYRGIQAGNLFFQGGAIANNQLAQNASAHMPASEERLKQQNRQTVYALATESAVARREHSPFDPSSPYTFFGTLFSKIATVSSSPKPTGKLSNFMTVVAASAGQLTPAATAFDDNLIYSSTYQECTDFPGVMCDFLGTPIMTGDYSTVDLSPDDPTYQRILKPNLKADGRTPKDNSELAKFINFCANRESPWGVRDANILNALQTDGGIIVNNLPIVNDIIDVVNFAEDSANEAWATGANCVNSASNPRWDSEFRYYQRYIQDMRILDTMEKSAGVEDDTKTFSANNANTPDDLVASDYSTLFSNPILDYEIAYDSTHPKDYSFAGTLARLSGQTKDDVRFILALADYATVLANYHPEKAFAFGGRPQTPRLALKLKPSFTTAPLSVVGQTPVFFTDKRNYLL